MSCERRGRELRLAPKARAALRAVVFDANAFGRGRPSLDSLRDWARLLADADLGCWVPEPVLWEWADHVADDWETVTQSQVQQRKAMARAGLELPPSPYSSRAEVVAAVERAVRAVPGLRVVPLSGDAAVEGLKDQVLQRAPGRRKDGVKTGAADSAWLRDVLEAVGERTEEVLLVTSDGDVARACEEWGVPTPDCRSLEELREALFEFDPAGDEAEQMVMAYLTRLLPLSLLTPYGTAPEDLALDLGPADLTRALDGAVGGYDTRVADADLEVLRQLVGLDDVRVDRVRGEVAATVFLLADAQVSLYYINADGRAHHDVVEVAGVLVVAELVFEVGEGTAAEGDTKTADPEQPGHRVVAVRSDGVLATRAPIRQFDAAEDALDEVRWSLQHVPGLELPKGWPYRGERPLTLSVRDVEVTLELSGDAFSDWELRVGAGGEMTELACAYDPGARVWLGKEDSFDAYPPYQLEPGDNPAWAPAGFVIAVLGR